MNEDQEVDVFHAVGQSRLARTQFVPTMVSMMISYAILPISGVSKEETITLLIVLIMLPTFALLPPRVFNNVHFE